MENYATFGNRLTQFHLFIVNGGETGIRTLEGR